MLFKTLHRWDLTPQEAIKLQRELSKKVLKEGKVEKVSCVAGVDTGICGEIGIGAIVVLDYPNLNIVEEVIVEEKINFPYIPGLLSFREIPVLLKAFWKLKTIPDLVFVDGQGILHPRRFGIASHLGLILNVPTIGCAKSLLCGEYSKPSLQKGAYSLVFDSGKVIGAALRTKDNTKEIFVSIGHRINLEEAIKYTLFATKNYRIPEPTRLADLRAGEYKRRGRVG